MIDKETVLYQCTVRDVKSVPIFSQRSWFFRMMPKNCRKILRFAQNDSGFAQNDMAFFLFVILRRSAPEDLNAAGVALAIFFDIS